MKDEYRSISGEASGQFKDRGSKFIAVATPVNSVEGVKEVLNRVRKQYHDARHHCYAYKLGTGDDDWRVNDDGEPAGTAGNPIMGQIKSFHLTNILIIVVRYFGGTLLGTGGLINAYRNAARQALENTVIVTGIINCTYHLKFPYEAMNDVMKVIKEDNLEQSDQVFDLDCSLKVHFRASLENKIRKKFELIEKLEFKKVFIN
ncbi:MAG TPA: YigZ family protein [Bacteroidetes bacterium]|nr:YigZ family protein [Bacteroidota bacterium]